MICFVPMQVAAALTSTTSHLNGDYYLHQGEILMLPTGELVGVPFECPATKVDSLNSETDRLPCFVSSVCMALAAPES